MIFADEIIKQDIKAGLKEKNAAELAGILADVMWTYVLEPQKVKEKETFKQYEREYNQTQDSFADLMRSLAAQYRFPELRRFRVEGNRVFLMFLDQEIEIKNCMENMPLKTAGKTEVKTIHSSEPSREVKVGTEKNSEENIRFKNLEL